MIDTHCHLTDPRLLNQLDDVLARAASLGVDRVITIGCDLADDLEAIELCQGRPNLRCVVGIHPNYVLEEDLHRLGQLRELAKSPAVVGLGEMGLDYFHHHATPELQAKLFRAQLELARETHLPAVLHCREAVDDALEILKDYGDIRCVFHCFTGTLHEAIRILERGYLIGLDGPVTYKKNQSLRDLARQMPLERLLIETDAPYLTPEPMRKQKINEPGLVRHVAECIAEVRGMSLVDLEAATTANAEQFFRWHAE